MIDIGMGTAMLHLRSPYLPFLEGWVHALAELAWELVVVLGFGKDPCRWYLELPTKSDALASPLCKYHFLGLDLPFVVPIAHRRYHVDITTLFEYCAPTVPCGYHYALPILRTDGTIWVTLRSSNMQ